MAGNRSIKARAACSVCIYMSLFVLLLLIGGYFTVYRGLDEALRAELHMPLLVFGGLSVVLIAITGICLYFQFERYLQPITRLKCMADRMAQGQLSDEPRNASSSDEEELGEMAELGDSLRKTSRLLNAYIEDIDHTLERMSRGDFTVKVAADYVGDFSSIKTSINSISDSLHNVFVLIDDAAHRTMGGSFQVSGASGRLTAGVSSQNTSVGALAESMEELRRQISQSTAYANSANRTAKEVDSEISALRALCTQLLNAINENRTASMEAFIQLGTLDKLVMQTGMLSINASAEAIRAGKQAYAFATVADEIHQFSNKTSVAARQAYEAITRAREAGERGQVMGKAVSDTLDALAQKSKKTATSANMVAAASDVQMQAVSRVRKDVSGISSVVHSNAQVAEQCTTSSAELTQQAQLLAKVLSAFYTKDSTSSKSRVSTRFAARGDDYIFYDFK